MDVRQVLKLIAFPWLTWDIIYFRKEKKKDVIEIVFWANGY